MEHNVIALEQPNLIRHLDSDAFHCFDNGKPSGELVRGQAVENTGSDPTLEDEELTTIMSDLTEQAMLLALL